MSWVRTIPDDEASGLLAQIYAETRAKHGCVVNLVRIQSLRPETMTIGRQLYRHLMDTASGLSRAQRYMVATVVSSLNACHY